MLRMGILLLILFMSMSGCGGNRQKQLFREISRNVGADVSKGELVSESDSHGGFHGDGSTAVEIRFEDSGFETQIEGVEGWKELPLTEHMTALVYGIHTENGSIGPMIQGEGQEPVIPNVQNGYCFFLDRHPESTNPKDDSNVLDRGSYNFTIAIYDLDARILYYLELDT